jgi:UDPglucose 6-dehydrogenase
LLSNKVIFDGRNLFEVAKLQQLGFQYSSVGRPQ